MAMSIKPGTNRGCTRGRELTQLARFAWRAFRARLRSARKGIAHPRVSLAVFDVSELHELRQIFGDGAARDSVAVIRRALRRIDPVVGRIARTTATSFAVLLPGYDPKAALAAVRDALGDSLSIESDWHGEEIVLVPDFLIRSSDDSPAAVDQLCRQMLDEIAGQQNAVRLHRDYLRRERQSHVPTTRPACLSAL